MTAPTITNPNAPRTDRQFETADKMLHVFGRKVDATKAAELRAWMDQHEAAGTLTKGRISKLIAGLGEGLDAAKTQPVQTALWGWNKSVEKPARPDVPAGRYAVGNAEGELRFYRVSVSDRGRYTVRVQASDALHEVPWSAALGILAKIAEDPKEASIRYGKELGVCGACGRTLTDEVSRAAGIGPICAARF